MESAFQRDGVIQFPVPGVPTASSPCTTSGFAMPIPIYFRHLDLQEHPLYSTEGPRMSPMQRLFQG